MTALGTSCQGRVYTQIAAHVKQPKQQLYKNPVMMTPRVSARNNRIFRIRSPTLIALQIKIEKVGASGKTKMCEHNPTSVSDGSKTEILRQV